MITLLEKFTSRYQVDRSGCWRWAGLPKDRYGNMSFEGKSYPAHRISYMLHKGEIPEGLHIDHLCRVKSCVNPAHLEAVTHRENAIRAIPFKRRHFVTKPDAYGNSGCSFAISAEVKRRLIAESKAKNMSLSTYLAALVMTHPERATAP